MNKHLFTSTLRELRTEFSNRNLWIILIGASVVIGLSGPFETFTHLPTLPRLLYWTLIVISTYVIGSAVSHVAAQLTSKFSTVLQITLTTLACGIGVTAYLAVVNYLLFGFRIALDASLIVQFAIVTVICAVVIIGGYLASDSEAAVAPPAILSRLPFDKRGSLVTISATDHYVEVITTKGREMLLMRLRDAISETGDVDGLQVHRSHWIAIEHVKAARRDRDRAVLTMSDGVEIPVSRSYMPAIRERGLLQR